MASVASLYPEFEPLRSTQFSDPSTEKDLADSLREWAPGLDRTTEKYMDANNVSLATLSRQDRAKYTMESLKERWRAAHVGRFRMWGFTAGDLFGLFAGILSFIAIMVQIGLIYKRKSACDISMGFIVINVVVQAATFLYGIMNQLRVQIITGAAGMAVVAWLLGLKLTFDGGDKCAQVAQVAELYRIGMNGGVDMQGIMMGALRAANLTAEPEEGQEEEEAEAEE